MKVTVIRQCFCLKLNRIDALRRTMWMYMQNAEEVAHRRMDLI
jgi:hypothetical protein